MAAASFEDLRRVDGDYVFRLGVSKTDQGGRGFEVPVAGGAARALARWLEMAAITEGSLFRRVLTDRRIGRRLSGAALNNIVKRRAALAALDGDFTFHSIRSGFVTEGARKGYNALTLMELTGHRSPTVFNK